MASNQNIRALVDDFVEQLSAEVHAAALASIEEALMRAGIGAASAGARRGPGRPAKNASAGAGTTVAAKPRRKKRGRKAKTGSISSEQLLAAIRTHNGERTEVIANNLGVSSKVFKPQLDALLADGTVKRKGRARGSTLHI
jgi:hypothetical protein